MAKRLLNKDTKTFWKEVKKCNGDSNNKTLATTVNKVTGDQNIANMWKEHYSKLLNSCTDIRLKQHVINKLKHCKSDNDDMKVECIEIVNAIEKLKNGKCAGLDGLNSEHYKYASDRVSVLLSLFYTACFVHGHLPKELMDSIIMPIVKDNKGDLTDKDNYRPLAITSVSSKIIELVYIDRYGDLLLSKDNQFGFKRKHGTDQCVFVLKEIIEYYVSFNSPVYVCYLDASKAFDRLNHWTLFDTLLKRGIPIFAVRLLKVWYTTQTFIVQWGSNLSTSFNVSNGVRQGGVLSPLLFNTYMDDLSVKLNETGVGCNINDIFINHLFYADDSVLLSPSAHGLQLLLNTCDEFANCKDITYNVKKTKCMIFLPKWLRDLKPHTFILGGRFLTTTCEHNYLGVIICDKLCDDICIRKQMKGIYARGNMLVRYFRKCSTEVKCQLFKSFCTSLYCCSLWTRYKKTVISAIEVAYKNVFRALMNVKRGSTTTEMINYNVPTFKSLLRNLIYGSKERLYDSDNTIIKTIVTSLYFMKSNTVKRWNASLYFLL